MGGYSRGGNGGSGDGGEDSETDQNMTLDEFQNTAETAASVASGAGSGTAGGVGAAVGASAVVGTGESPPNVEDEPEDDDDNTEEIEKDSPSEEPTEIPEGEEPSENPSTVPDSETSESDESPSPDSPGLDTDSEFNSVIIVIATDPWDGISWQMEATYKRLKRMYGGNVSLWYVPLPPRPLTIAAVSGGVQNPILPTTNWNGTLPNETTVSARALAAAYELGYEEYQRLLRQLQIAVHAQGIDIEDTTQIARLAHEAQLDYEAFSEVYADTTVDDPEPSSSTSIVKAGDIAIPLHEYVSPDTALSMSVFGLIKPDPLAVLRSPAGFVRAFPFSASEEVAVAYDDSIEEVENRLGQDPQLMCTEYGGHHFWYKMSDDY